MLCLERKLGPPVLSFVYSPWAKTKGLGEMEPCKCWSRSTDPKEEVSSIELLFIASPYLVSETFLSLHFFQRKEEIKKNVHVLATQLGVFGVFSFFFWTSPPRDEPSLTRPLSQRFSAWRTQGMPCSFLRGPNKTWRARWAIFFLAENPSFERDGFSPYTPHSKI
jgi:hypothetical protein